MRSVDDSDFAAPIYGLLGITHGWGVLLTVMSAAGAGAIARRIDPGPDVVLRMAEGRLPQYHQRRAGALDRLIETYGIVVLDNAAWNAKKAELGEAIYR